MKSVSARQLVYLSMGFAWLASWLAAGPLLSLLRDVGFVLPRGLVLSSGLSELLFSLLSLSAILAVWALGGLLVRPFRKGTVFRDEPADVVLRAELNERKSRLLLAMRELDFDGATGKVSDEDRAILGDRIRREAAEVYAELDRLEPVQRYRAEIERDVAEILARGGPA
ncbi:MAG: hypothetical protein HYY84_00055 [Deltaproteobacteria bacterium]|nr:hypothetical protein [Deltaproteobacteria bacterium]